MKITPKEIEDYCRAHSTPLPPLFDELREATFAELEYPQMQVGLLEGRFLALLAGLVSAKRVLEFGTFSGYSALALASALPEGGEVVTCDIDPKVKDFTARYWAKSEHGKKIRLELGAGVDTLPKLRGPFDLVFIDADKPGYRAYWDGSLPLLRPGGLLVVDNVLWSGAVLAPKEENDHHIHAFNEYARQDPRVELVMLPVRDGMLLARKR